MHQFLRQLKLKTTPSEEGQGLVEYALVLVLVAVVVIGVVALFGNSLVQSYLSIDLAMTSASAVVCSPYTDGGGGQGTLCVSKLRAAYHTGSQIYWYSYMGTACPSGTTHVHIFSGQWPFSTTQWNSVAVSTQPTELCLQNS